MTGRHLPDRFGQAQGACAAVDQAVEDLGGLWPLLVIAAIQVVQQPG